MAEQPVILVTAGSAGLGAAVSRLFASAGFRVVVNYSSNRDRAEHLVSELNANHVAVRADLSSRAQVTRLVEEAVAATGRLDVVFSNVGWSQFRDTSRLDDNLVDHDWDHAYTMNVKTHLWLLHAAEEHLARSEGCFVTTSSVAGVSGMGSSLAYSVSKAAQIHLVKGLAAMVAPRIRVNCVSPGLLETEWSTRFSEEQKEGHKARTRLKRFVRVEDVAEQVLAFARNRSVTGVNVVIDAGFTL